MDVIVPEEETAWCLDKGCGKTGSSTWGIFTPCYKSLRGLGQWSGFCSWKSVQDGRAGKSIHFYANPPFWNKAAAPGGDFQFAIAPVARFKGGGGTSSGVEQGEGRELNPGGKGQIMSGQRLSKRARISYHAEQIAKINAEPDDE